MRYRNARDLFPKDVLALIQQYADGEYIYIPRKVENRKQWGDNTRSKTETKERNQKIYSLYQSGHKVSELAHAFFLSEKSIQRIVALGKKHEHP